MTTYNIATASSRMDTKWRNTTITWDELKERCQPIRTNETLEQYQAMSKDERGNIKDVGGFVGGTLKEDGNRKNDNLLNRTLLTIDVDNAKELPEKPNPQYAMIVHSTHSHTEEAPRYRVISPLSRPCSPTEYKAVAHRMAEGVGMEQVDMTSCEPARLMYWASSPSDAPIYYYAQDGSPIDVDAILGTYKDWRNPEEWPTPDKPLANRLPQMPDKLRNVSGRQGDPKRKNNIVGSWCRNHDVYDVLDNMLSGLYTPAGRDRYTYSEGSTFGGVVVYDNGDFFYSYHNTDPLGGRLLNSWDLYRLAVYGHLDREAAPRTRTDRLPSSHAMQEYAMKDEKVKADFVALHIEEPSGEFDVDFPPGESADRDWLAELEVDKNGGFSNTLGNFYKILKNDTNLIKGKVKYDEFKRDKVIVNKLAWEREGDYLWTDADMAQVALYIEQTYKIRHAGNLQLMMEAVVREDDFRFNGVTNYIEEEKWDGTPRVDDLFIKYLGVEDTEFNRMITRKSIVACVARAYQPGIKFDQIIVLAGEQGIGKSSILKKLAGDYFMDSFSLDNKSNKMQEAVVGSWIIEIPELEGFYKQDMNTIKSFVSKQQDRFRPAYGKETVEVKRTCVFFATTNDEEFLRDGSGNRRFWILQCGTPKESVFTLTEHDIHQIWAEAKTLWDLGKTTLYLDRKEAQELKDIQKRYDTDNDQIGALEAFLDTLVPYDWHTFQMEERRAYFMALKNGVQYRRNNAVESPCIGTEVRTEISAIEIVNEFMMVDNGKGNFQTKVANNLLKKLDDWVFTGERRRLGGGYGRQKIYAKIQGK